MRPLPSVQRLLSARAAEKVAQSTSTSGVSVCVARRAPGELAGPRARLNPTNHRHGGEDRGVREEMKGSKCVEKDSLYPDSERAP